MSKLLISIIILMFCGAVAVRLATPVPGIPNESQLISDNVPYEAAFSGEYVCLPPKDTNGPQTLECAVGLKLYDGSYIALDLSDFFNKGQEMQFATNTRIRVIGTFVPIEQISANTWQKYSISGILQANVVEKI